MSPARSSLLALCAPFLVAACSDDDLTAAPSGGTGGSTASAGGRGNAGSKPDASDGDETGGREAGGAPGAEGGEPTGPRALTLLHGVTDTPWIAFCFAKVENGVEGELSAEWLPRAGLGFGRSIAVTSLPGVTLGRDAVRPYVIAAASEDVVRGLDCAAAVARARAEATPPVVDASVPSEDGGSALDGGIADAGPRDAAADHYVPPPPIADVRAVALPVIPASALAPEESYLVALAGCIGGTGVTHPAEQSICGPGYTPDQPTLTETLVRLSRQTNTGHVGLQFLMASPAFGRTDLALVPALQGDALFVAENVAAGALRPPQPYFKATAFELSPTSDTAKVQVYSTGAVTAAYEKSWAPTLAAGAVTVQNERTYTLIYVGPSPGFTAQNWWNDPLVTIVDNIP